MPKTHYLGLYLVEPAKSGRSKCVISKLTIEEGELRFGSFTHNGTYGVYQWRKLEYISQKLVADVYRNVGGVSHVAGYKALTAAEREKLRQIFTKGEKNRPAKEKPKTTAVADKRKPKAKSILKRKKNWETLRHWISNRKI